MTTTYVGGSPWGPASGGVGCPEQQPGGRLVSGVGAEQGSGCSWSSRVPAPSTDSILERPQVLTLSCLRSVSFG